MANTSITRSGISNQLKYNSMLVGNPSYDPYWAGAIPSINSTDEIGAVPAPDGSFYLLGTSSQIVSGSAMLLKFTKAGSIAWQKRISRASAMEGTAAVVDSSGNIYIGGNSTISSQTRIVVAKLNSSGVLQWEKAYGNPSWRMDVRDMAIDSSNNIYLVGMDLGSNSTGDALIIKLDSSGNLLWQRGLNGGSNDWATGVSVDLSGNVYVAGYYGSGGQGDGFVAKYNTSGTYQWAKVLTGNNNEDAYDVSADSSGNSYVIAFNPRTGSTEHSTLLKFDTSGNLQWQRALQRGGGPGRVFVASDNNVYYSSTTQTGGLLVAKYNASGTIQWQRLINGSSSETPRGISLDASGNMFVTFRYGSDQYNIFKLPNDGSKTGTYNVAGTSFTYSVSSLSELAGTMNAGNSGQSGYTPSVSSYTPSLTVADSNYTVESTVI